MPSIALCCGIVLMIAGAGLVVFERRVWQRLHELRTDPAVDPRHGNFLRDRSLRRKKIGQWIALLGAGMTSGELVVPREHPILYVAGWTMAGVIAVVLVRLAALDYIALRRHWGGELLRTTNDLERARSELQRHLGPDADRPKP